jgi:GTPase SAR1 family protein
VSYEEGEELSKGYSISFVEVSALSNVKVNEVFLELVSDILANNQYEASILQQQQQQLKQQQLEIEKQLLEKSQSRGCRGWCTLL